MTDKTRKYGPNTTIVHAGSDPQNQRGAVNPPVYHVSTVAHPSMDAMREARMGSDRNFVYGRHGTPTSMAFEEAAAAIEGGERAKAVSSGLQAVVAATLAFVEGGDHILMLDSAYAPSRRMTEGILAKMGVETTFYDPLIGAGIAELMRPNTKVVFTESPASHTFEVQDIPAIVDAAHKGGAVVIIDNTWSAGHYFKPLAHGVDVSVQAATKYWVGHSDAMLGCIITSEEHFPKIRASVAALGCSAAPDDCYLGLRGIRTLSVRLERHEQNGLKLAEWFAGQTAVDRVLHPAFNTCPGHEFWKRDFTGASGLFSVVLNPVGQKAVDAMVDGLELYSLGGSWGGYESLVLPSSLEGSRTATEWDFSKPCVRFHAGLEDIDDLIEDARAGLSRLNAAA